ncbi:hypothetical protein EC912_10270 [Luteibacter rhizovicinus]|uniref:Uncharacterized protein n=1 Tax=Luteibacter rhizovicinus TaxID=242606 RepID=A0A4R3YTG0_9GAMM|nr:hypothetical protein [Luteibacter rhizovicinus]TCV95726.1 hypothetical protein EC912_10270 [Luteibacter rhizovicinus]
MLLIVLSIIVAAIVFYFSAAHNAYGVPGTGRGGGQMGADAKVDTHARLCRAAQAPLLPDLT